MHFQVQRAKLAVEYAKVHLGLQDGDVELHERVHGLHDLARFRRRKEMLFEVFRLPVDDAPKNLHHEPVAFLRDGDALGRSSGCPRRALFRGTASEGVSRRKPS